MARFKQIMKFSILIVIFIIFSNFMIKVGLKNSYKTISGEIKSVSPQITVTQAKTTDVNGYVNATVKNNSEEEIKLKYIKLDLYSRNDVNLGTEYLELTNLKPSEEKEIKIEYRYSNVKYYVISSTDSKE